MTIPRVMVARSLLSRLKQKVKVVAPRTLKGYFFQSYCLKYLIRDPSVARGLFIKRIDTMKLPSFERILL